MRSRLIVAGLMMAAVLAIAAPARAAGAATWSTERIVDKQKGVVAYTVSWTSSAGGAVSGHATLVRGGELAQVVFIPGTAGTQPTDLYDATLLDQSGLDTLGGMGANLLNAGPVSVDTVGHWFDAGTTIDVTIANAGNAKTGTVILILLRTPSAQNP